jgi:hypothetical protein
MRCGKGAATDRRKRICKASLRLARISLQRALWHDSQADVSAIDCRSLAIYGAKDHQLGEWWGARAMPESRSLLDRTFGLSEHNTNVRTEFIAGLTTFLTMVYIVFVNPTILANAGMDKGAVFVATCIAAAVSTLAMALYANYPIALAPGMGLNAFFAFTVVLA